MNKDIHPDSRFACGYCINLKSFSNSPCKGDEKIGFLHNGEELQQNF